MEFEIDRKEVLRYLQVAEDLKDDNINRLIEESILELKKVIKFRYLYQKFSLKKLNEGLKIKNTTLTLKGKSIKKHLENSDQVYLMAATLGNQVDKKIAYYEKISVTKSMIFDACATTAIEEACDKVESKIRKEVLAAGNKGITFRYSPGYGDLSIDIQKKFLTVLKAAKKIGLTASKYNLLLPSKSVTAIIGVLDGKDKKENNFQTVAEKREDFKTKSLEFEDQICKECLAFEDCKLRMRGIYCGAKRKNRK